MSKSIVSMSAQAFVAQVESALKSFRGTEVSVNCRSVWVTAPQTASKKLEAMGFKYAAKKNAWWYTYADASAIVKPEKVAAKITPAKKAQPKKVSAPKAEKAYEELPEDVKERVLAHYRAIAPGADVALKGTWVYVRGESTRECKDALKAEGLHWGFKTGAWCGPVPEQVREPICLPAPKAEPEKAQPKAKKAKKTALKDGVVSLAGLL